MQKGITLGWVLSNDGRQVLVGDRDVSEIGAAGARVVRMELRLGSRSGWDADLLGRYGGVIDHFGRAGIGVIGLLSHEIVPGAKQDLWNAGSAELGGSATGNPYLDRYAESVRQIVSALPTISHWEIWNEPNSWKSHNGAVYSGGSFIYPSLYASLLARAAAAIKGIQPNSTVLSGGILGHNIHGVLSSENSGAVYLQQVYRALAIAGRPFPCDALGLHLYMDQGSTADPGHLQRYLAEHEALAGEAPGVNRRLPIYITEVAWDTRSTTPEQQAANTTTLLEVCGRNPTVAVVCWFLLRDNPAASQYFGLSDVHWIRKPAFGAFASFS
jgi:hypothetical protein